MSVEIADRWLRQAVHDLDMAEKNTRIGGHDVAAFLAHQAVEKLLKAVMIARTGTCPRIHYLDELAREVPLPDDLFQDILDLTVDYTLSRYPDVGENLPCEEYTAEIAADKVARARRVFEFVMRLYEEASKGRL